MTFPKKTIHLRQTRYEQCHKRFHQVQAGEPVSLLGLLTGKQKGRCTPLGNLGPASCATKSSTQVNVFFLHKWKRLQGSKGSGIFKITFELGMDMQNRLALNLPFCCHWCYTPPSPAVSYKVMLVGHIC